MALGDPPVLEVDLGVDAEAADDAGDRVPRHLDQVAWFAFHRDGSRMPWLSSTSSFLWIAAVLGFRRPSSIRVVDCKRVACHPRRCERLRSRAGAASATSVPCRPSGPSTWRRLRITGPYSADWRVVETLPPGGSSMNGMNLSGKPGHGAADADAADVGAAADAVRSSRAWARCT